MIKFRDYARITETLLAMKHINTFLVKYGEDIEDVDYVHIKIAYNRLEEGLIEKYPDLEQHFEPGKDKARQIDFLLKLFEIGERARVTR